MRKSKEINQEENTEEFFSEHFLESILKQKRNTDWKILPCKASNLNFA